MTVLQNLIQLVSSGGTILHGSPRAFFEILPSKTKEGNAVCATVVPEIALYHALLRGTPGGSPKSIPGKIGTGEWSFNKRKQEPGVFTIRITPKRLDFLLLNPPLRGYVYPMDTYDFEKRGLAECRLYNSRFLRKKILVTEADLPFTPIPGHLEYKLVLPYKFKHHFAIESNL